LKSMQHEIEDHFNALQDSIEKAAMQAYQINPTAAKDVLTKYTIACAQTTHDTWRKLGEFLMVKYCDGVVRQEKNGKFLKDSNGMALPVKRPGYPIDFLREYVKQTGDRYLIPENKVN
jgi:hypothetical protein